MCSFINSQLLREWRNKDHAYLYYIIKAVNVYQINLLSSTNSAVTDL